MICRKATVALPDANFLSSWCQSLSFRAQNRGFCALLGSETLVFGLFKHKIGVFVLVQTENGIGKCNRGDAYRKRGVPANHRARFQNANAS